MLLSGALTKRISPTYAKVSLESRVLPRGRGSLTSPAEIDFLCKAPHLARVTR